MQRGAVRTKDVGVRAYLSSLSRGSGSPEKSLIAFRESGGIHECRTALRDCLPLAADEALQDFDGANHDSLERAIREANTAILYFLLHGLPKKGAILPQLTRSLAEVMHRHRTVTLATTQPKVALDFGRVIADDVLPSGELMSRDTFQQRPPIEGALESVAELVGHLGRDSVYVLKNARGPHGEDDPETQESMRRETMRWLNHWSCRERTGLEEDHIYFPRLRRDKVRLCLKFHIPYVVEDRGEIGQHITSQAWFLFRPRVSEVRRYLEKIPPHVRCRMFITSSWHEALPGILEPLEVEAERLDRILRLELDRDSFLTDLAAAG